MIRVPHQEGHYWAKLTNPSIPEAEGQDWQSTDWEVVQVFYNNGKGAEKWRVFVPGIAPSLPFEDFVWGPFIAQYTGGRLKE